MTTDRAWQARQLLRAARVGTLATSAKGQPFASLVTPAASPDLDVLLLLSSLAEHTRHLVADPRCSVMVSGVAETANPQTTPRLTLIGVAEVVDDAALKARYLAIHPYAELYAGFGDFALWRLRPTAASFVGGFARAARFRAADLAPDAVAIAAIAAAEADIIGHCNVARLAALATLGEAPGSWRMVAVDPDGCDLSNGEATRRIAWSGPVASPDEIGREFELALGERRRAASS
jgi:putative heme iron utilization protein